MPFVQDPVCGRPLDTKLFAIQSMHQGGTYYFCSKRCQERFEANPEQFIGQKEPAWPKKDGVRS